MYQYLSDKQKKQLFCAVVSVLVLLTAFIFIQAVSSIKQFSYIGHDANPTNVISVTGTGEVLAVPDTATFYYSVVEQGKTVAEAQDKASQKGNDIISALKALGIAEADIQTTDYSSYPTYQWQNAVCVQASDVPTPATDVSSSAGGVSGSGSTVSSAIYIPTYCPPGKQTLTGYEVNQTVTVKVRKTADAGTALTKVGALGASNISGLSFVVDNLDAVQAQARDKAIQDAKAKAAVLAKSLGVKMTKIINFYENGSQPYPVYATGAVDMLSVKAAGSAVTVPQLPVGQNKITSNVTITYELQ
jgi:uncharacterized protein YggE